MKPAGSDHDHPPPAGGILRRAIRNTGLLLSGKGAAGLMQLGTFAIATRALGATAFGTFSLVLAQVMLLTAIASFDSNQAVIRYGVRHLARRDHPAFQALLKAGLLLDFGAAAAAALATVLLAPYVGRYLGWDEQTIEIAQLAAPLAFANAISTAKGVLRLFDRYDLLTTQSIITPVARLILFLALAACDARLDFYIVAWVAAGWLGAGAAIAFAWRESRRQDMLRGMTLSFWRLSTTNPGVFSFSLVTNLNASVALIPTQLATLIVGALLGPASAGIFRLAREVGAGMLKPVDLANQALFADMARLVAAREWSRLLRTAARAGLLAFGIGAALTLLVALLGRDLISALFGRAFEPAAPLLIAIGAATSIRVLTFAADPILYGLGHDLAPLCISGASALAFVAALLWRLPVDGLIGASWAYVAAGILTATLSAFSAATMITRAMNKCA